MIGEQVGNYVIRAKLGEGGMGAVYLAEHPRLGRRVAVKVLLPRFGREPELVARFFNEARAAAEIKNQHIVDVLDFGERPDGSSYIVMEWLDGQSLGAALKREGAFPLARAVHVVRGIARALAAAHARGIVHRDLKPDNVFLIRRDDDEDFVKVLDFGIAKLSLEGAVDVRTQAGAIFGSPEYMSPEQCNGTPVDGRTDIYALGVILYQMLTGRLPFRGKGVADLLAAHLTQAPIPPRSLDPHIPVEAERAILQALEKDRERRFSRVEALLAALEAIDTNPPVSAPGLQPVLPPAPTPLAPSTQPDFPVRSGPSDTSPSPAPAITAQPVPLASVAPSVPPLQTALAPRRRSRTRRFVLWGAVLFAVASAVAVGEVIHEHSVASDDSSSDSGTTNEVHDDSPAAPLGQPSGPSPSSICSAACVRMNGCGLTIAPDCEARCEGMGGVFRDCAAQAHGDCNGLALCMFRDFAANNCPIGEGVPNGNSSCADAANCEATCLAEGGGPACLCGCMTNASSTQALRLMIDNSCALVRCASACAAGGVQCNNCAGRECADEIAQCEAN